LHCNTPPSKLVINSYFIPNARYNHPKFLLLHFSKGIVGNLKMYQARHLKAKRNGFILLTGIETYIVDWATVVSFFGKLNPIFVLSTQQNYKRSLCLVLQMLWQRNKTVGSKPGVI